MKTNKTGFCSAWRICLAVVFVTLSFAQLSLADSWPDLILPDDTKAIVVADQIDINRLPMRIWQFHSNKTPDQILAFYRDKWVKPYKKGSPAFIENTTAEWRIISRAENGFLTAVQIDSRNKLESDGLFSISQLEGSIVAAARVSHLPEYPKMPGSTVLEELNNHDAGKNALTIILENGNSPASNRSYYKSFYESRGWTEIGTHSGASADADVLLLQKGPLEASFTFISKNARTQVVGSIQYVED